MNEARKIIAYLYLRSKGVETSYGFVTLYGLPQIKKHPGSRIIIDSNVTLISDPYENPTGICHPVSISTHSSSALIHIMSGTGISGATICAADKVIIGKSVAIGVNVSIYDTDFHAISADERFGSNWEKTKKIPVYIDDKVWIGAHTIILKGVVIGKGTVVGAGSVVPKSIPAGVLYAGNPAKYIKSI